MGLETGPPRRRRTVGPSGPRFAPPEGQGGARGWRWRLGFVPGVAGLGPAEPARPCPAVGGRQGPERWCALSVLRAMGAAACSSMPSAAAPPAGRKPSSPGGTACRRAVANRPFCGTRGGEERRVYSWGSAVDAPEGPCYGDVTCPSELPCVAVHSVAKPARGKLNRLFLEGQNALQSFAGRGPRAPRHAAPAAFNFQRLKEPREPPPGPRPPLPRPPPAPPP